MNAQARALLGRWAAFACPLVLLFVGWSALKAVEYRRALDKAIANKEIESSQLDHYREIDTLMIYGTPLFLALVAIFVGFILTRGWYGRKNGPGVHVFDNSLSSVGSDIRKTLQWNAARRKCEEEALRIENSTPPVIHSSKRPRL